MSAQPEALRIADELTTLKPYAIADKCRWDAATELRRLHAANVDCMNHFNAMHDERDELLDALKKSQGLLLAMYLVLPSDGQREIIGKMMAENKTVIEKAQA